MPNPVTEPPHPLLQALDGMPIVGIIRGCPVRHLEAIAAAAVDSGFGVLEVTLDSPDPLRSISTVADRFPSVVVGAGTVHTAAQAADAARAGARCIVTPFLSDEVMAAARELGIPILPGAATPTEIRRALDLGAAAVKVFPARELGGPDYLKAVGGPLGHPPLVPTGGVGAGNGRAFIEAGALALGVGGSVFPSGALATGDTMRVGSLASALVEAIT